jgi:hypothetical protein
MKRIIVAACISVMLTACGTGNKTLGLTPAADTATPVKDTKISTDFTDQGVKVFYTLTGAVDRIEVTGNAPAWRGNVDVVAEADALDKLVKFVYGQSVNSERRNRIITKTLDRARDNTLNSFRTVDGGMTFDAREVSRDLDRDDNKAVPQARPDGDSNERSNTSRRIADRVEQGLVEATTTITSQGRLTGIRKISDRVVQDGRLYVAVYQWSPRDQSTSEYIRQQMR